MNMRKRNEAQLGSDTDSESEASECREERTRKSKRRRLSHVAIEGPEFPRSRYQGWRPPLQRTTEREAISDLKTAFDSAYASSDEKPEYVFFELDDFSCYRPGQGTHAYELSSLDRLQNRGGFDQFLFDGILSFGSEKRYVQGIPFPTLSVDGYCDPDITDLRNGVYIQSRVAANEEVWYRLGKPSREYRRFFTPFIWLAEMTKYFVDFLLDNEDVTLEHFRRRFYGWLFSRHSSKPRFRSWLAKCNLRDFRSTVSANVGFLWKECHSIEDGMGLLNHRLWGETDPVKLTAIPCQDLEETKTVVTPFAYECFRGMYFAAHLEARTIANDAVIEAVAQRKLALNLTPFGVSAGPETSLATPKSMPQTPPKSSGLLHISEGDVVCVRPDEQSIWRSASTIWYAYVQGVRPLEYTTELDILWLYEPSDTTLGKAFYPFSNELFISDNCACGKDAIDITCVVDKVDIEWFVSDPSSTSGLFVRQKYRTIHDEDTYDFVALEQSDFRCGCADRTPIFVECRRRFQIGDTILYREFNSEAEEDRLEPGQIVDFIPSSQRVLIRRLHRATEEDDSAKANELLLTEDIVDKSPSMVIRPCYVRFFYSDVVMEELPTPYNQNGTGDFFFIVHDSDNSGIQTPAGLSDAMSNLSLPNDDLQSKLPPIDQGWDPDAEPPAQKLKGLGIFCGGGNLDRGLEEGGAVEFKFAVDYNEHALHTYRANAKDASQLQLFLGSVDDYLGQALAGSVKEVIAQVGEVDVLAAGSPCPGFSTANMRRQDPRALRNCSMVASVVSYVDFYSPKYCVLENVVPMAKQNGDQNVFKQILASFVAMGYQVRQYLMESWFFGSSEKRSRVFIVASAPGVIPFLPPDYTHGHAGNWRSRKLGQSSNGLSFGVRKDQFAAFDHVSPRRATRDLPDIGDSLVQICPEFPDHRTPSDQNNLARSCISLVPAHPSGMGFVQAVKESEKQELLGEKERCISGEPRDFYERKIKPHKMRNHERSQVYARVDSSELFPTILTTLHTQDGIHGRSLHWEQPRTLTVMEARRAQGYPDDEVIIGSAQQQWRIIGNSVERKVALNLGLSLRASWMNDSP